MFAKIKEELSFLDVYNHYLGDTYPLKEGGGDTWSTEEDDCPWCGHNGCFKVRVDEGYAKCFSASCVHPEHPADHIEFVRRTLNLGSPGEAALRIIKDFNLDIPTGWSIQQKIFNAAAEYYSRCMMTQETYGELEGHNPIEYQTVERGHTQYALDRIRIGWADGRLYDFLIQQGFDRKDIEESPLIRRAGVDFFERVFVYPSYDEHGRCFNFTIKRGKADRDREGKAKKTYQVPVKVRPCQGVFQGQNEMHFDKIAIVEGENDRASLYDSGWREGVLCCNGQLSKEQIDFIKEKLSDKKVYTFFDHDEAGLKYVEKLWKAGALNKIPHLKQYMVPAEHNDIDSYFQRSGSDGMELLYATMELARPTDEDVGAIQIEEVGAVKILEARGRYYTIKYQGDEEKHIPISNFVIKLKNIYVREGQRIREIVVQHANGMTSRPFLVDSEQKVSLKAFKEMAANSVDGFFKGNEQDMINVWEHVYMHEDARIVEIPVGVGDVTSEAGGWLFRNLYITKSGSVVEADKGGVFWNRADRGIKPASIQSSLMDSQNDLNAHSLPSINMDVLPEEHGPLLHEFLHHLSKNLGSVGTALSIVAWCNASANSNVLFKKYNFFPFLLMWGRHGQGKTTIARWLLSLFDMEQEGLTTVSQLRSSVGLERKAMYYHSLPLCIDEIRADKVTKDLYKNWRGYYNRSPRAMGTKEGFGVRVVPINSTFIFSGQDTFTDSAMRSRCVSIKMPTRGRDHDAYVWMEANKEYFSAIALKWILEASVRDDNEMFAEMREIEQKLLETRCDARMAKTWCIIAYFALRMQREFFPDFDYMAYLLNEVKVDREEQIDSDMVTEFWEAVTGLQVGERPVLTNEHLRVDEEKGEIYVWLRTVYDQVSVANSRIDREKFSYSAVREALRDEQCFRGEQRPRMGRDGIQRRCMVFDAASAPESLKLVAEFAKRAY